MSALLKSLKVRRFQCGEEEAASLGKALASSQVETLEITEGIGRESARFMVKALAEALKTNSSVRDITLEKNGIGLEGAQALAEALKTNSSVRDMNLEGNEIGPEGAQALAEALKTSSSVRDMNLAWNDIGPEGAQALAEALKTNGSVRDMNLENNGIGPEGAQALADALQRKTSVRDTLADSDSDDTGAKESVDQVPGRRPFEAPVRLKALAEALKMNVSVKNIDLSSRYYNYSIGDEGVKALAEALRTNTSVTSIDLDFSKIGDEGAKALEQVIEEKNKMGFQIYIFSS